MANIDLDHLSFSSINLYQLCARAWEYRYVKRVSTPASPNLVFGSAFHSAIEALIYARAKRQAVAPHTAWTVKWSEAIQQEIAWDSESPEELSNTGLRMLVCPDTTDLLNSIKPMMQDDGEPMIERRIELHVPEVPIPIIGYIDIILEDGTVGDFKTSASAWPPNKAAKESQPLFYLAALNQAGFPLTQYRARHYVFVKTKKPQVQVLDTERSIGEIFSLLRTIRDVWRGIEAGSFLMNTATWKHSKKWCDYWDLCQGS